MTLRTPPMIMSPEKTVLLVPSENVRVSIPQSSTSTGLALMKRRSGDRKSTRLNSSHDQISYAVFCLKKKKRLAFLLAILVRKIHYLSDVSIRIDVILGLVR